MHRVRTRTPGRIGTLVGCLLVACLGATPGIAAAATPGAPVPVAPAAGAGMDDGSSVEFRWTGNLLGATGEQARSFFRVEIAETGDVPAGVDAEWPSLVNFAITTPGAATTSATIGAPGAGSYDWRVCAWGVTDPAVSQELTSQGCSPAQSFSVRAAATHDMGAVGEMAMPGKTTLVTTPDRVVTRTRNVSEPAPAPTNVVRTLPTKPTHAPAAHFDVTRLARAVKSHETGAPPIKAPDVPGLSLSTRDDSGWGSALGGLGNLGSGVVGALGWHLPGVPIPFWTLLLLFMPIPLAFWWKRSVLGMFDMPVVGDLPAGSLDLDGDGDPLEADSTFKDLPAPADGAATTTATAPGSEFPDHESAAA